ncbi:MAG: glycosyltransferase [Flavisolibacter sp.]
MNKKTKITLISGVASIKPAILVVPLDWGLGHATRCIPVIKALLDNNCCVYLAGDGPVKILLAREFPTLTFLDLQGYKVHYPLKDWKLVFHLLGQLPSLMAVIAYERKWLDKQVIKFSIDAVISDNRYGLYHRSLPCCFITHQLGLKSGYGRIIDNWIQSIHFRFINRFTQCWVPDNEGEINLAGDLSHSLHHPGIPLKYMGVISRFTPLDRLTEPKRLLFIISGPEPQRTLFEDLLRKEVACGGFKLTIIRGKPDKTEHFSPCEGIEIFNHLPASEMEEKIAEASIVIARCGYSSVMDLIRMKKKCIFIPTPGQPEQVYLAKHLMDHQFALCIDQKKFRLKAALELAYNFPYYYMEDNNNKQLKNLIASFITGLSKSTVA